MKHSSRNPEIPVGTRFGRLVTISRHIYGLGNGSARVWVRCDCQKTKIVLATALTGRGDARSCGCLQRELQSKRARLMIRHGFTRAGSPRFSEYTTWERMVSRCTKPTDTQYHNYGGRGIKVCDRWIGNFAAFLEDMGRKPSAKHSLDRINNDGDYEPSNVRWATAKEQCNNRRITIFLTVDGARLPMSVWAERAGVSYTTVNKRIRKGWSHEDAVRVPVRDPLWISPRRLHYIKEPLDGVSPQKVSAGA